MSTYIYIIDDLVFFFVGIVILYLFVLAVAAHFKRIVYPKAEKKYHCAILVPEESPLPVIYREKFYEFFTYNDLHQGINTLDREHYQLVLILSDTAISLSPLFLEKIYNAYDAGIQAIQLHTVIENRKGFCNRFRAICKEIKNSLFRAGNTQFGLSSNLSETNIAIDLGWLQNNLKSSKTNIERKFGRMYILTTFRMLLYTVNQVRFTHIGDASERQPLISSLRFWKGTGISVTE